VCIVIIDDDFREGNEKFRLLLALPKSTLKKFNVWADKQSFADIKIIGNIVSSLLVLNFTTYYPQMILMMVWGY